MQYTYCTTVNIYGTRNLYSVVDLMSLLLYMYMHTTQQLIHDLCVLVQVEDEYLCDSLKSKYIVQPPKGMTALIYLQYWWCCSELFLFVVS